MNYDDFDLDGLRIPQVGVPDEKAGVRRLPSNKRHFDKSNWIDGEFINGRLPLSWWGLACQLSGPKILPVALAIWFLAGLRGRKYDLSLTSATLQRFSVTDRSTKYRALKSLENAGLIQVRRRPGKNPLVTILESAERAVTDTSESAPHPHG
jgi:hypothetical protein